MLIRVTKEAFSQAPVPTSMAIYINAAPEGPALCINSDGLLVRESFDFPDPLGVGVGWLDLHDMSSFLHTAKARICA